MPRDNGQDGIYLFPVNQSQAYIVRDNHQCRLVCCKGSRQYDIFIVTGDTPTYDEHDHAGYICSADSYKTACMLVEHGMTQFV